MRWQRTNGFVQARSALAFAFFLAAGPPPQAQTAPKFNVDLSWPKPLPNKWKMGGVTGLAVDKDDNVWVYDRPNDLTSIEVEAELNPPIADCCVHPPSMIHIAGHDGPGYKDGEVISYFDAPQGHGMAVDKQGFVYLGQNTVRKYDPKTGKMLMAVPHVPETPTASRLPSRPFRSVPRVRAAPGRWPDLSPCPALLSELAGKQRTQRPHCNRPPSLPSIRRPRP